MIREAEPWGGKAVTGRNVASLRRRAPFTRVEHGLPLRQRRLPPSLGLPPLWISPQPETLAQPNISLHSPFEKFSIRYSHSKSSAGESSGTRIATMGALWSISGRGISFSTIIPFATR